MFSAFVRRRTSDQFTLPFERKRPSRSLAGKLNHLWLCFMLLMGFVAGVRGQNVTIEIPIELAGDNISLAEMIYLSEGDYAPVARNLTALGLDSTGTRFRYGADFEFSAGGNFVLENQSSNGMVTGAFVQEEVRIFTQSEITNQGALQIGFAIPESRVGHVFALWSPLSGEVYPITAGGIVGLQGDMGWTSLGFFTARCFHAFEASYNISSLRLVDLTTNEGLAAGQTNAVSASWTSVAGLLPTIGVSAYVADTWTYTLHTGGGSLQSLSVNWSFDGYYLSGQVGLGESFWFSRDVDGATSPTFFCNGDTWFDIRPYISEYTGRSLATYSFQIGQEYAGRNFVIVHPDGYTSPVNQEGWDSWLQGWDDYGNMYYYSYRSATAEVDTNQSWALIDNNTGESFGQTTALGSGLTIEHPSAPSFISLTLRASRMLSTLWLVQDHGEEWNVTVHSDIQTINGSFMGRSYTIPVISATAPYLPESGFHLFDVLIGDESLSVSAGATEADLSNWYLPRTAVQLRIDESRWFNQLYLVQPAADPFGIAKGSIQGVWTGGAGGNQFSSFQFYDGASEAHPDAIWLLWDATRNQYIDPDPGTAADFLLAYDGTDTDSDGLPDWWERTKGLNPNNPGDATGIDEDGDGRMDRDEFSDGTDHRAKDNMILQLSASGFVSP